MHMVTSDQYTPQRIVRFMLALVVPQLLMMVMLAVGESGAIAGSPTKATVLVTVLVVSTYVLGLAVNWLLLHPMFRRDRTVMLACMLLTLVYMICGGLQLSALIYGGN
jgi:hypothetical protein